MNVKLQDFLIDFLTKSYQIIFAVMVVTPLTSSKTNLGLIIVGLGLCALIFFGSIFLARMKGVKK
jgi:hypothetical protein